MSLISVIAAISKSFGSASTPIPDEVDGFEYPGFEYAGFQMALPDLIAPTVTSIIAINATTIRVTFSKATTPTIQGWSFNNGSALIPSAVSLLSGFSWNFTVSGLAFGQTITGAYNSATGNTIDASGNELVTFTGRAVTNNIPEVGMGSTAPTILDYVVNDNLRNYMYLIADKMLDETSVPSPSDFTISGGKSITSIGIYGSTIEIIINSSYAYGDVITIGYTAGVNPIQDLAGNDLPNFSPHLVVNGIVGSGDTTAPILLSAVIYNGEPNKIILSYSETLNASSVPATSAFSPSGGRTVSAVSVESGTGNVFVTVNTPYANGNVVTIGYTAGASPLQDLAGNNAANFTAQAVTNNIAAPGSTETLSFTAISTGTEIVSPARGVEHWNDLIPNTWDGSYRITVPSGNAEALDAYCRFVWHEMETSQGVYDWTRFDIFVQSCISRGKKASFGIMHQLSGNGINSDGALHTYPLYVHNAMQALGNPAQRDFIYDNAWIPNYNAEAFLSAFENLNDAIAAHIAGTTYAGVPYSEVIGYIDIRGIGEFGEWHHYPYHDTIYGSARFPTVATYKRIIDSHKNSFPNYPLLALISGYDSNAAAYTPAEVTHYLLTQSNAWGKYGWRWDSIGETYSQILENNPGSYLGVDFSNEIMDRYKFARVGGEPSSWEGGVSNNFAQSLYFRVPSQVTQYGMSFFGNGNYNAASMDANASANIRNASRAAGYRIILNGGTLSEVLESAALSITLNWRNTGVAPVYEDWQIKYELQNQSGGAVVWTGNSAFNLKLFLPNASATAHTDNFTLPAIAAGTYRLVVKIVDPNDYRAPFPIAITGRQGDGAYILKSNIVFS